ncbi:MAG: hypothetical protein WCX88_03860 [Patescibacteria group bacterium]
MSTYKKITYLCLSFLVIFCFSLNLSLAAELTVDTEEASVDPDAVYLDSTRVPKPVEPAINTLPVEDSGIGNSQPFGDGEAVLDETKTEPVVTDEAVTTEIQPSVENNVAEIILDQSSQTENNPAKNPTDWRQIFIFVFGGGIILLLGILFIKELIKK